MWSIDCSSYIANDILSAVALMEADSVLRLANCDLKSIGYLSSQLPLLRELHWMRTSSIRRRPTSSPSRRRTASVRYLGASLSSFRIPGSWRSSIWRARF